MSDELPIRTLKASRPSQFGEQLNDDKLERERARLGNLERYMYRARAGLPIFDDRKPEGM